MVGGRRACCSRLHKGNRQVAPRHKRKGVRFDLCWKKQKKKLFFAPVRGTERGTAAMRVVLLPMRETAERVTHPAAVDMVVMAAIFVCSSVCWGWEVCAGRSESDGLIGWDRTDSSRRRDRCACDGTAWIRFKRRVN